MRNVKMTIWIMVAVLMLWILATPANAEDTYWVGGIGDWNDLANWDLKVPDEHDTAYIDNGGTAQINTSSACADYVYLGYSYYGASGNIELSGTGQFSSAHLECIGHAGTGIFKHSGGDNSADTIYLGHQWESEGTYNLFGGQLNAINEHIGLGGTGVFDHTGGRNSSHGEITLGTQWGAVGTYNLSAGEVSSHNEYIGFGGIGIFNHADGNNSAYFICLGYGLAGVEGTYNLSGGEVSSSTEHIGHSGIGDFNQTGGTNSASEVIVGLGDTSTSSYELSGTGQLSASSETIGREGVGTFNQSGGTNKVNASLTIGQFAGSDGTYTISGGVLNSNQIRVGPEGNGHFEIENPDASITVWGELLFGVASVFTAVDGSIIRMDGASFDNCNIDETDLSGLSNLELIFDGGQGAGTCTFEVASTIDGGFSDNFALGALTLGGEDIGLVQLVDNWNNGNRGVSDECLFVCDLIINDGSKLDLSGLKLYGEGNVEDLWDSWIAGGNTGRLFDSTLTGSYYLDAVYVDAYNWTTTEVVPEPTTLLLLGLGGLMLRKHKA